MNLISVSSSAILAIGWAGNILRVVFVVGGTYDHPGVPYAVYLALLGASSKGSYYRAPPKTQQNEEPR